MRPDRPSGFTLVELLVALGISAVVLVAVLGVGIAQQRAAYDGHRQRAAQASTRSALLTLEQALQLAGYGLDAPLAFDMGRYQGPCPTELGSCPRDATDNEDELVFYARNPRYWAPSSFSADPAGSAWRLKAISSSSVTLYGRTGDRLRKGQVLQAVCKGGAKYAYFTVGQTNPTALSAPGDLTATLAGVVTSDPFKRQDLTTDTCFTSNAGPARVFLVDRYRFHVRPVATGGAKEPFLMLDTGTDTDGNGQVDEADEIFVAEGVELLQFAYVMTNPNLAPRGLTAAMPLTAGEPPGAASGDGMTTLLFPSATAPSGTQTLYDVVSWYPYSVGPPAAPARLTDHQANIRAIRIGLVVRSPTAEPGVTGLTTPAPLYNMTRLPAWLDVTPRYNRVQLETTVPLRNMAVRGMSDS